MKKLFAIILFSYIFVSASVAVSKPPTKLSLNVKNTGAIYSTIDDVNADNIVNSLLFKKMFLLPGQKLNILVYSGGGQVEVAYKILQVLNNLIPDANLICRDCASSAAYIFCGFTGNKYVLKHSIIRMHEIYIPNVTANMVKNSKQLEQLIKISDGFNFDMASFLKIPLKKYEKNINKTSWELEGAQIVKQNCAKEVIQLECDDYISRLFPETCKDN